MQWNWVRSLVLPRGRPCGGVAEAVPIGLGKHTSRQAPPPATSAEISDGRVPGNDPEIERLLAQGRQADEAADWPVAEKLWRRAIGRGANEISAFLGLSTALRHQDRLPEAEAYLRDALVRLPPDLDCLMRYAEMADQRQDWAAAEQRWEALGQHFPHMWCACLGRAKAMGELDRPDEAIALLSGAAIRYPWEPAMLYELGRLADRRGDWPAAERHWRAALGLGGHLWWIYTGLASALEHQGRLTEAETVVLGGQPHDPGEISLFTFPARLASEREDWVEAERRWRIVQERFPDRLFGYQGAAAAMRHLHRFDDAEAMLREASARFPDEGGFLHERARLAETRSDWAAAVDHWRASLAIDADARGADAGWVYAALAEALVRLGEPRQAETVLLARQSSHPTEIGGFTAYARLAEGDRVWEAAEIRWQVVLEQFPDLADGYEGVIRSQRQAGRLTEAAAVLARGLRLFPAAPGLLFETAHLSLLVGKTDEALRILALIRQQFPGLLAGSIDAAGILRIAGRYDEAETLLTEAMKKFPDHSAVWDAVGQVVEARGDWNGAVAHWAEMGRRFPHSEYRAMRLHVALLRLAELDPTAADIAAQAVGLGSIGGSLRDLALGFESLGGCGTAGGCEFGFFQRMCGAEPLGLLRWAFVSPESLITCLNERFAGVGDPATTEIFLGEGKPAELWDVRDTRLGIAMHSFVTSKEVPYERMLELTQKRMRYLKDKLIADLENPTKIFVFKAADRHLTPAELEALGRGIRSYGSGEILCVFASGAEHPPGKVEVRAPGVRVGYLDFSSLLDHRSRTPAWIGLCRTVLDMDAATLACHRDEIAGEAISTTGFDDREIASSPGSRQ